MMIFIKRANVTDKTIVIGNKNFTNNKYATEKEFSILKNIPSVTLDGLQPELRGHVCPHRVRIKIP